MKGAKLQRLTQMRFDIGETFQNCLFTDSTRVDDKSITLFFDDNPKKSIKIQTINAMIRFIIEFIISHYIYYTTIKRSVIP